MNQKQRTSAVGYLYDISKGIALASVVDTLLKDKWNVATVVFGIAGALVFFSWAYLIEGGKENE